MCFLFIFVCNLLYSVSGGELSVASHAAPRAIAGLNKMVSRSVCSVLKLCEVITSFALLQLLNSVHLSKTHIFLLDFLIFLSIASNLLACNNTKLKHLK